VTALKIAAAAALRLTASEPPEPLRPRLQQAMAQPPRRINRLTELALLGAHRCLNGARPEPRCPLFLALTHGCVADGVALVTHVVTTGLPPSPIAFINMSSNMAGFYVAAALGIRGSNQALAADDLSFEAALELASLGHEHCPQRLIGAVEECAWPLAEHRRRLELSPDRALSECSHWLFVDQAAARPLATVQWVRRYGSEGAARAALARERWPAGGQLALSAALRDQRERWAQLTGLTPLADADEAHSGHWTAQRICGFVESGEGSCLLHVSARASGCYAVYVTR
jgi:hypothetical protein